MPSAKRGALYCAPQSDRPIPFMARSKQLLIIAHSIQPPGGGNGVGAWILQALRRDYRLTLLSWDECDLASVNRHYGTSLETDDFRLLRVPRRLRWVEAVPGSFSLVKYHLLMRFARGIAAHYEGVVSTCNEMDLGVPGIQYVHYPWGWLPRPEHSEEEYRRMRGRMYGGVGAGRGNPPGYPIRRSTSPDLPSRSAWHCQRRDFAIQPIPKSILF